MTLICKSCGAENAPEALSCWKCDASGEALRGGKKATSAFVWVTAAAVAVGALGGGAWWAVLRDGAPYAGVLNLASTPAAAPAPSTTPAPATDETPRAQLPDWMKPFVTPPDGAATPADVGTPMTPAGIPASGEAALLAEPVDGPFFILFKQLLPDDYGRIVGPLLVQVPDPITDADRFDALLLDQLEILQRVNGDTIARAQSSVLAELAANMQRALRTPEICHAGLQRTPLAHSNIEARRIASASNTSLIRAIASGRTSKLVREQPTTQQVEAFYQTLKSRLLANQWTFFESGRMGELPVDQQCAILAAYWGVIAGYSQEDAARWTAWQMSALNGQQ